MRKANWLNGVLVVLSVASCSSDRTSSASKLATESNDVKIQGMAICGKMMISDKSSVEDITNSRALNFAAACELAKTNNNFTDQAYEHDCKSSSSAAGGDTNGMVFGSSKMASWFDGGVSYDQSKKSEHCRTKEDYTAYVNSSIRSKCSESLSNQQLQKIFSEQKSRLNVEIAKQVNECMRIVQNSYGDNLDCRGAVNGGSVALKISLLDSAGYLRAPVKLDVMPSIKLNQKVETFNLNAGASGKIFLATVTKPKDPVNLMYSASVDTNRNDFKENSCYWIYNEYAEATCDGTRYVNLQTGKVFSENSPLCAPKPEPVVVVPEKPVPRFVLRQNGAGFLCSKPAHGEPNKLCTFSDCKAVCNVPTCRMAEKNEVRDLKGWKGWDGHILLHDRTSDFEVCRVQGKTWDVSCGTPNQNVSGQACGCTCGL